MERTTVSNEQESGAVIGNSCLECGKPIALDALYCGHACEVLHEVSRAGKLDFTPFVTCDDEICSMTLSVSGIHCASCIRLIENALGQEDGITSVRVNMTSERVLIAWKGSKKLANLYADVVIRMGYGLKPLSDATRSLNDAEEKGLLRAIAVAGFAAGNIMLLSVVLWSSAGDASGVGNELGEATRDLFHWLSALISVPTVLYAGRPFFKSAWAVLKQRHTNMDVPISLAVILATAMSLYETVNHGAHVYFDSAVMLLFFLLTGRYLDARTKSKARASAAGLLEKLAGTARRIEGDTIEDIPLSALKTGMVLQVSMGENIPADGTVLKGDSEIDNSLLTGETMPEAVTKGSVVYAGTTNLIAPFTMVVSKASEKSLLSEIVRLMENAEQGAAKYVRLADRVAGLYTPVVHLLALATFLGWMFIGDAVWQVALLHSVTVLIITCPCALGLAVPVVQMLASGSLMRGGVLLKSGSALEKLAAIDTVVFDKTGTLTYGHLKLLDADGFAPWTAEHLKLAASMAIASQHPLSKALIRAFQGPYYDMDVAEVSGKGLTTVFEGKTYMLGRESWVVGGDKTDSNNAQLGEQKGPEFWLAAEGEDPVRFCFFDMPKSDAAATVKRFIALGVQSHILSGDKEGVVAALANNVGISSYKAAVTPDEKAQYIKALQEKGHKVLVVGDGLNDAPALASADVSMSPSSAVDITQNTADIVFQGQNLSPVIFTFKVARLAHVLVHQNLGLAILYNIIAVPMAIIGLVTPLVAAIAMSSSSLIVIANAFRINLLKQEK